ncbi:cytochrome P450 [Nonomuraea sp. NPDC049309]|uniref:cytochrome P450 n=1 Tax=Nonomuraea sp. NPDC049309 TaxID=3364350 RepID=UPI003723DA78
MGSGVLPAALLAGDGVVEGMLRRTGGMFGLWAPGLGRAVVVSDPALVRAVMRAPDGVMAASPAGRMREPVIGPRGLARLEGDEHREIRSIMAPVVRDRVHERLREATERLALRAAATCPRGRPFALRPLLHRALLEAVLELVAGLSPERQRAWRTPLRELLRRADSYEVTVRYALRHAGALDWWPGYHRAKEACDRLIHAEIRRRRKAGGEGDDLLGALLRARDDDDAPLPDAVVRDQVMSMIAGARTTTANGLAWVFERVVRHPEVLRRVTGESEKGEGDAYASAVTYEALRVRPPVTFFGRTVRRPFELGGRMLAPGTTVIVHLRTLHHDPALYPDPAAFRPERWLDGRPAGYGWMPFGGGAHTCLGDRLAMVQMRTFLQVFARELALSPAWPGDERVRWKAFCNVPAAGCRVIAHPR